jgi:hypothetical protein
MKPIERFLRRLQKAWKPGSWDANLVVSGLSTAGTLAAAIFAAVSARASLDAVEESRAARHPVFVAEPRDEAVIVQFRNDEGFNTVPIVARGDALLTESAPVIRFTNYGAAPAVNVRIDYRWVDPAPVLSIPSEYSRESVRGHPRIVTANGRLGTYLEGGIALSAFQPVSLGGVATVGSVGPGASKDVRLPLSVTYALFPMMLNDAVREDARARGFFDKGGLPPVDPIASHDLQIDISSDSITGTRFFQRFMVRFTTASATDRHEKISGSEFGKDTLARIEADERIEVVETTFPKRVSSGLRVERPFSD